MPSYGSLHSPSLSKMNGNHVEGGSGRGFGSKFSFGRLGNNGEESGLTFTGHIVGDPFALATISIAYVRLPFRAAAPRTTSLTE